MAIKLSFSSCQRYMSSPMSYFLHYIAKIRPVDKGSALFFGSSVDEGLNSLLIDKMEGRSIDLEKAKNEFLKSFTITSFNGEDLNLSIPGVVKFSKADYDESILTEEDRNSGLDQSWCSLKNKGFIIIEEFNEQVIPKLDKVLAVQLEINIKNETGDEFTGKTDFIAVIDGKTWLVDNKTTSVSYKASSASESGQLATYYDFLKDDYKLDGVMFITLSKTVLKRKKPRINIKFISGQISEELIQKTFEEFDAVLEGIKNKQFECSRNCLKNPWGCSYRSYCNSEGSDLTGLVKLEKKK